MPLSLQHIVGKYAYRFNGYSMVNNIRYNLAGVGLLQIRNNGKISGRHQSAITPVQGQQAELSTGAYELKGDIKLGADGAGQAEIYFKKTRGDGDDVDGKFFVQVAGSPDRLWFISSGATLPKSKGTSADELVTLEAVRMVAP
jgi:hypothetical protein